MGRVAIFGATGKLGQELVSAALDRGREINAVVRDPRKMTRQHEAITTLQADVTTGKGIDAALTGCDLVIWAIAADEPIVAAGLGQLLGELAWSRVPKPLIFISGVGVEPGDSDALGRWGWRRLLPGVRTALLEDLGRAEELLRTSAVPHVTVRPTGFSESGVGRTVAAVGTQDPRPGPMSLAAFASFILGLDDGPEIWGREVVVGSSDAPGVPAGPDVDRASPPPTEPPPSFPPPREEPARAALVTGLPEFNPEDDPFGPKE